MSSASGRSRHAATAASYAGCATSRQCGVPIEGSLRIAFVPPTVICHSAARV